MAFYHTGNLPFYLFFNGSDSRFEGDGGKMLGQFQVACPGELKKSLTERAKLGNNPATRNLYSLERYNISDALFKLHFKEIISIIGREEQRRNN
jgi:hypothetical protein